MGEKAGDQPLSLKPLTSPEAIFGEITQVLVDPVRYARRPRCPGDHHLVATDIDDGSSQCFLYVSTWNPTIICNNHSCSTFNIFKWYVKHFLIGSWKQIVHPCITLSWNTLVVTRPFLQQHISPSATKSNVNALSFHFEAFEAFICHRILVYYIDGLSSKKCSLSQFL